MFNPGDQDLIDAVDRHIEACVAPVDQVFHEIVSDDLHIDIHQVFATGERPFHTLVTSGMSARPMNTSPDAEEFRFAELCILLDPTWRLNDEAIKDERCYWPMRLLKVLARYPHETNTWLGHGHTVAMSDPPKRFARNTRLCASVLLGPTTLGTEFSRMPRPDGADTHFWNVLPIYAGELQFKFDRGLDALLEAFDAAGVTDVVSADRPPAVDTGKRPWWPFRTTRTQ